MRVERITRNKRKNSTDNYLIVNSGILLFFIFDTKILVWSILKVSHFFIYFFYVYLGFINFLFKYDSNVEYHYIWIGKYNFRSVINSYPYTFKLYNFRTVCYCMWCAIGIILIINIIILSIKTSIIIIMIVVCNLVIFTGQRSQIACLPDI
jgi:hypothetical protein